MPRCEHGDLRRTFRNQTFFIFWVLGIKSDHQGSTSTFWTASTVQSRRNDRAATHSPTSYYSLVAWRGFSLLSPLLSSPSLSFPHSLPPLPLPSHCMHICACWEYMYTHVCGGQKLTSVFYYTSLQLLFQIQSLTEPGAYSQARQRALGVCAPLP